MGSLSDSSHSVSGSSSGGFQQVVAAFMSQPGLPFAAVLSAGRVARIFAKHKNLFAMSGIYSTVNVLWAFLGQVLRDGKAAACQAAVAAITAHRLASGLATPTSDTGDYCKARAKLSQVALRELTVEIADELEERAEAPWLWNKLHAKLVDGFTFTMPDTPENQAEYPQSRSQKKGVGLPIARGLAILSLATAAVLDVAARGCTKSDTSISVVAAAWARETIWSSGRNRSVRNGWTRRRTRRSPRRWNCANCGSRWSSPAPARRRSRS